MTTRIRTADSAVRVEPIADRAILVEFGDVMNDFTILNVRRLDQQLAAAPPPGVVEVVPSGVNVLVMFDPLATDHDLVSAAVLRLLRARSVADQPSMNHEVAVCYQPEYAPDLHALADRVGLSPVDVVTAHTASDYRVVMFGFAPGAAYLCGVDPTIRVPRKPSPVRNVPAGSVIIAGEQCLVMTITMPTGWWVIGRAVTIPRPGVGSPETGPLLDVGDVVRFIPVARSRLLAGEGS